MGDTVGDQSVTTRCKNCGTLRNPFDRCPKCGNTPEELSEELARINKAITDMRQRDVQLSGDLKKLSGQLQAAIHQRNLITNLERERQQKRAKTAKTPPQEPQAPRAPRSSALPKQPRRPGAPRVAPLEDLPPEASPRAIQNVQLILGPLLLAITAVIFALIDLNVNVDPTARLTVLGVVTVGLLAAAPILVSRGLSSTAEALAVVGLTLLPIDGYVLARLDIVANSGVSSTTTAGLIFAASTLIAFLFHQATALTTARYAMVLGIQPVLPLLAYDHVHSAAGWAVVFTVVAAQNALIARVLERFHMPTPTPVGRSTFWLWEVTWILHGIAIGAGLVYAMAALLNAPDVASTSRAALTVLFAGVVGLFGALMLRRKPMGDVAAGVLTLAVIGSAARVAIMAIPEQAPMAVAVVIFGTGLAIRSLPPISRRGPQLTSAAAVAIVGGFVIVDVFRAAAAPILTALPVWSAELNGFSAEVAARGAGSWELLVTIALLSASAALALPPAFRRESAVAGTLLTGLAAPACLGLSWMATIIVLTVLAIALLGSGIGIGSLQVGQRMAGEEPPGWAVTTDHGATAHLITTVIAGGAALTVALARPWSTAGVLVAFVAAGVALAAAQRSLPTPAETVKLGDTATGAAAFATPGAVATALMTLIPGIHTPVALTAGFLAASTTLAMVAVRLVAHRRIGTPLAIGTGLGALAITGAAFVIDDAEVLDAGVGAVLLVAAIMLTLAPSIDEGRRADRWLDGADVAAAAVTVAATASLARAAELASPQLWMFMAAAAVLVVALSIRILPEEWRRGPAVGAGIAGVMLGVVAGYPALAGGIRAVTTPGELWAADLTATQPVLPFGWQAPAALVLLAAAAMVALPRPRNYDAAAVAVVLATVGTPAALGLPWWASIVLGLIIGTCYAVAATVAVDARAGYARLTVAVIVALHSLTASLVLLWTTSAALATVAIVSAAVAALAAWFARMSIVEGGQPPSHLDVVGGTGVLAALITGPCAVATYVVSVGGLPDTALTSTLIATGGGLGVVALWRRTLAPYLGWATVGVAMVGTSIAIVALVLGRPAGVYAGGAVLLVILAELLRAGVRPLLRERPVKEKVLPQGARLWRLRRDDAPQRFWPSHPGTMAAAGAAAPAFIAIGSLAPALRASLLMPYDRLDAVWQGPPPPLDFAVDQTGVLTALLLTISAAIAAIGFGGGLTRAVSVVVPGIALTILIAPVSLGMPWPASVMAGLLVFTLCMLSVALTVPPVQDESTSGIRAARVTVLIIGLIGGGAGLAGSLATPSLTIFTFGGAIVVGLAAALGGRTQRSRILGWLGGAVAAELFVLCVSLRIGAKPEWAAFAVLGVGTALIAAAALLPRFTRPAAIPEASAMEWAGYTAAVIALALAARSPAHVSGLLAAWGAVLGMTATRPGRSGQQRRILWWAAAGSMIAAWWLILISRDVAFDFIEIYSVPFALLALAVGLIELKQRPQMGSWTAYGPALIAGFGPTIVMALLNEGPAWREVALLLGATAVLVFGSQRQQRAPVTIGSIVLTIAAFHALTLVDWTWLAVGITGVVLVILGASSERRRRAMDRYNQYR